MIDQKHRDTAIMSQVRFEDLRMVTRELREEIRRLHHADGMTVSALSRRFELDRKTIRRCLRDEAWRPYHRPARRDTLLAMHEGYLRGRAPQVNYSAQILFQELQAEHGYRGSYDTVKRFVAPLRAEATRGDLCVTRFETPPGWQTQIDWGQSKVWIGRRRVIQHLFVMTLGFSRRMFCKALPNERIGNFLDAHEQAFEHFGGRTHEHLYDRPRTVCHPGSDGRVVWNTTFKAFADYWGFEPRLCRPYRAQTKGKVESGVKYLKHNFLPGRRFIDQADFDAQLAEWNERIADRRLHGTTHERPIERFERERPRLVPTQGQPSFRLQARVSRVVADDYLVAYDTNRYSVPFQLIGQRVELLPRDQRLEIHHRGGLVATHRLCNGRHQLTILPEHGPGAIARNARRHVAGRRPGEREMAQRGEVEIRDLAIYEQLAGLAQGVTP
ncbi:MAG: IS21 family transposase [Gammaproteobacteria bacterium]|nr:IS21 family transposase [Gammaproteobacteria bacterium]